ncbi:coiled-coil domain-containing protein 157 [Patagioenas fasciata monilis]|uniref:Coiled-coil domain-containing protein 157 n=1 Tax=Patagioenas fasciata monilis TaxID=372326 RepID=A0A1V4JSN6_PATFA|nr:coiled-coil domain-containing protein 157 [Patagioenas fasciata monilis]
MAQLLGHPGCMESLRADLRDLQAAIGDVWARAGPVRFPSWKFPDRVSCELDVPALLERYSHRHGDPQFSQHAHVALLELLIDRLLLLLQSFTGYAENLLSERDEPPGQAVGPGMSAGLTARRYWCSMLKLGAFCQQLLAEKKAGKEELPALQPTPQAGNAEKKHPKHSLPDVLEIRTSTEVPKSTSPCPSSSVRGSDSVTPGSSVPRAAGSAAASSHSVPTQTAGSAPGACDTCASAQASLRQVGKAITSVCQSQNIPSALSRFQEMVEDPTGPSRTLSATDLSYWAVEQSKDLARISKHLQTLLQQVNPLKSELQESQKQKDELRKKVEDFSRLLQAEKETQAQQRRKAEQSLKVKNKEHLEAVARLEQDKDDLRRGAALLEERLSALKEELAAKQAEVQELEVTKTTLLEEMRTMMVAKSQVLELEEKVQLLTEQQESLSQELSSTNTQLEKEKAKVESVLRHQESLQSKQQVLLQQLDSLDQEREELQAQLGEAEEDGARLAEQLEQSREQLQAQQELLDVLQQEKLSLEQNVSELQAKVSRLEEQVQELQERERLLVFFPELHVPSEAQFESSGSVTEDMEKQLEANSIRIGVLEQENARLRSALAKVQVAAAQGVLKTDTCDAAAPGDRREQELVRAHGTSPDTAAHAFGLCN